MFVCWLPNKLIFLICFTNWPQRTPMRTSCVQDSENISSCEFDVFPVVPNKLGKVMKYEAKKMMSIVFLKTLKIEWGQIDPKGNWRGDTSVVRGILKRPSVTRKLQPWNALACWSGAAVSPHRSSHVTAQCCSLIESLTQPRCFCTDTRLRPNRIHTEGNTRSKERRCDCWAISAL